MKKLEDNKTHYNRHEFPSTSSTRLYVAAQAKSNDEWQCSCPGWITCKKPKKPCQHLRKLEEFLSKKNDFLGKYKTHNGPIGSLDDMKKIADQVAGEDLKIEISDPKAEKTRKINLEDL